MTEVPEHLLQRSRERRAAMGGGDGDAADAGESTAQESGSTPAPSTGGAPAPAAASVPAHPAPAEPEPPKPPTPMVDAYTKRRKIPFWAMPVIAALPVWAYVYAGTLEPPPQETPETLGEELYSAQCASCHGGTGGGGIGPAFTDGALFETWPAFEDHFEWVRVGSTGWPEDTYGANDKPVFGAGEMPGFDEDGISDAELTYIILYERQLAGENPDPEDQARLAALADMMFHDESLSLFADPENGVEEGAIDMLEEMIASGEINLEDFAAE